MSCRDQPCCFKCKARNLRHSRPSAGRTSGISIPLYYAARRVTFFAQRSVKRPPRATASGRTAEDTMSDELTARQRAISLRLAGQTVKHICAALGRSEAWFHKWWGRYLEAGPEGLYDLTRARLVAPRVAPEVERAILSVRR